MADVKLNIITNFSDAVKGTKDLTNSMDNLNKETEQYNENVKKSMNNAVKSTQKQNQQVQRQKGLIEDLDDTIKDWEQRLRKATNVKDIEKYNRKIAEGRKHLEEYKKRGVPAMKEVNKQATVGTGLFNKLGGAIAAAFSIGLITRFAKESMRLYDQQAKAERKLLVALKGRTGIQKQLLRQATELQKITLFGDEQTIEAQAQLAKLLGANYETISKLTPLVQDLATIYGMDLATAADLVGKSVGSSTNALSRYGIQIEGSVGSAERLETAVRELNRVVGGQAEEAAKVGTAAFQQLSNAWGDFREKIGRDLTDVLLPVAAVLNDIFNVDTKSTKEINKEIEKTRDLYFETDKLLQKAATNAEEFWSKKTGQDQTIESLRELARLNEEAGRPLVDLNKQLDQIDFLFKEVVKYENQIKELGGTIDQETTKAIELSLEERQKIFEAHMIRMQEEAQRLQDLETLGLPVAETMDELTNQFLSIGEETEVFMEEEDEKVEKGLDEIIKTYQKKQEEFRAFQESHPFFASLGLKSEEELQALQSFASAMNDIVNSITQSWVDNTKRVVDTLNTRIAEQQRAIEIEAQLAEAGKANSLSLEKSKLQELQKARERALKDQEKALKAQRAIESASQAISLTSAIANILRDYTTIPFVGLALATAAITGMLQLFKSQKSNIGELTQFAEGGEIKGRSHAQGGVKVPGMGIELEGGEYVINKKAYAKYPDLVEAINKDNFRVKHDHLDVKVADQNVSLRETKEIKEIRDILKRLENQPRVEYYDGYRIETFGNVRRRIG